MADKQKIWTDLAAHFSGTKTFDEDQWLQQASEEEKNLFYEAKKVWSFTEVESPDFTPDTDAAWQRMQIKLRFRKKKESGVWKVMTAVVILLFTVGFATQYFWSREDTLKISALNEVKHVILPDSSEVWLNQGAAITYNPTFNISGREVYLTGEAFFKVREAEGRRFTIFTENSKIEVIGTSFNVKAVGEDVKVQVATGKVALSSIEDDKAIYLTPGEEGILTKNVKRARKQVIQDENFRYWQNKELTFRNEALDDIVQTIEEKYKIEIIIKSSELENCRFTTTFNNPDIEKVMEILALTGNLTIDKTENGYEISGEGCQ